MCARVRGGLSALHALFALPGQFINTLFNDFIFIFTVFDIDKELKAIFFMCLYNVNIVCV